MKLDCVLTAVNEKKEYLDLAPIFIETWNKLYPNVDIKIILIAKKIPEELIQYKDKIILFEPIKNVSTCFTSQFIRNLYPCILNYDNGVMITDIDNLPMNKTFFTKNIENIPDNKWINLRDYVYCNREICMMWQVATPKVWKDVFNIKNEEDIKQTLISENNSINYIDGHNKSGWNTDQLFLYKKVMQWNKKTNDYVFLKDKETGYNRLCSFGTLNSQYKISKLIKINIKKGKYSDYHCLKPMSYNKCKKINWIIYNLLPNTI